MEAAAETVRHLTRTILPERPHQLAQSPDWRSTFEEHPKRIEEWENSRLQYMTLVSEADRGVLFTRGYYDIRPEPPRPVPREVNALARGSAKKLSLSDYTKKKTGAATSTSPPDTTPSQSQKRSSDRQAPPEPKQSDEARRTGSKLGSADLKPKAALNDALGDSRYVQWVPQAISESAHPYFQTLTGFSLPPKPSSLPPRPPSPERRKRVSDVDDNARPSKKPKPTGTPRQSDDKAPGKRDEGPSRKPPETLSSRDPTPLRDGKSLKGAPLSNGRIASKSMTTTTSRPLSPPPRSRESNGARAATSERSERTRGGSIKVDVNPKSSVPLPPLLSPLRLDLEGAKESLARKGDKRPREGGADAPRGSKPKNAEAQHSSKRPKSPFRLPPLLSPTLPPEVEAELERDRRRKGSPRTVEVRPASDISESAKRLRAESQAEDVIESRGRKSYIVTLKVPRKLRARWMRIEDPTSGKGIRQERPGNACTTAPSTVAEKRPAGLGSEAPSDYPTAKKTRVPDVLVPPRMPPSTPSKRGAISMSRVSSSGSLARTPGDVANATPSVSASVDRVFNAPEPLPRMHHAKQQSLRELESSLISVGKRLKHNGDLFMKDRLDHNAATNGNVRASETNIKLGYVLILESTIAFMMGFHVQDTWRTAAGKVSDHKTWLSLFPLLDFVQKDMRRFEVRRMRPLFTISMVLQVFAYDEMLRAQCTHESPPHLTLQDVLKARRSHDRLIAQIRDTTALMESHMYPHVTILTTVEEVAEMAMQIIRRWCADEGIEHTPELNLKEINIKSLL